MFYSVDGKIVQVGEAFCNRRVNMLTFQVEGSQFPNFSTGDINNNRNYFWFDSLVENSVTVNWGDGVTEVFNFSSDGNPDFRIGWTGNGQETSRGITGDVLAGRHIYQDSNTGLRTITFEFNDLSKIFFNDVSQTILNGIYPDEIGAASALNRIRLFKSTKLIGLPQSLSNVSGINSIALSDTFITPLNVIPDSFFSNPLTNLTVAGSFILTNPISSNFFKINQLSDTLEFFQASQCEIVVLPKELGECTKLEDLRINGNSIINPEVVESLLNLTRLYISTDPTAELFETDNLNKITNLSLRDMQPDQINTIPQKWTGFKSLKTFTVFQFIIQSDTSFDIFINAFYELCTTNGFLNPASTQAVNTGFPEQFRDISWGDDSDWFTLSDPIQAPSGFSLGISNGTPANNAEKIYVLVENYGHTVELAP
jgi:hypothetical protein